MNTLAIDQKKFSSSVDAGFVLALSFHHGDLEPDCVGFNEVGGGAYARDKNTSTRLCAKIVGGGGGLYARGDLLAGHYGIYNMYLMVDST